MLPAIAQLKLTLVLAALTPAPTPAVPKAEVRLYDENLRVHATVDIGLDGSTDAATTKQLTHLFRCRQSGREHAISRKTLALLAEVATRYPGKTIEFVSVYRATRTESMESPHRGARAIDFRIRGVDLAALRDYLWKSHREVGIGWYPSEQFIHMDTRPGENEIAWTFANGVNHYNPYWAELARHPAPAKQDRRPGV